jgi:hypothetical protein
VKLRRALTKLVGNRAHEAGPGEEVPPEAEDEDEDAPTGSAGAPSGGLAITFTLVERPRDEH